MRLTISLSSWALKPAFSQSLTVLRTTGAQSDAAKKKCESDVKAGSGNYPVKFDVQKPTKTTDNTAEVAVKSMAPSGTVKLKKEDGKFRIDDVK